MIINLHKFNSQPKNQKIIKAIFTIIILSFLSSFCLAQNIWINNPQDWRSGQGRIDETSITYKPQGTFMKVDWEITFSAKGLTTFTDKDTLEVVYNFKLPQGAIVTDSWLWFGDSILKAMILDRWSASQVYENIVNRRRDPSILTRYGNYYELRIYPMAAKESRKVKITFLTPANWTNKNVSSHFLSENLLVSKYPIRNITVQAVLDKGWKNPVISGVNQIPLESSQSEFVPYDESNASYLAHLNYGQLGNYQKFEVSSPMNDGFYLSFFENKGENFYQLALDPLKGMDIRMPQKLLFLIDYQKENSNLSQHEVLKLLANEIQGLLNVKDSFNILYHDFELKTADENWIAGDSTSIVNAIVNLGENPFVSYSSLATLLASGIEYAQEREGSKIIVLANSDRIDDVDAANNLIEDLLKLMDPVLPVYIGDFQTSNYRYYSIQNYNYRGNEYFYQNLAKLTGGDYINSFEGGSFTDCVTNIVQLAMSESGLIDIHTTLENGFCYGRYNLSANNGNPFSSIFLQVGKYSGDFPFKVEISGLYHNEIFSKTLSIEKENAIPSDSVLGTFWYGKEILQMESLGNSYSFINDIIDKSIDNRILSNYTAFLCLEPGMMDQLENINENGQITRGWEDGPIIATNTETIASKETEIDAYPNPFSDRVNIEIQLSENVDCENVQLEIYDLFGKRIKVFNIEDSNGDFEFKISWDATDDSGILVSKGTYLFVCSTSEGRITKKLVVM